MSEDITATLLQSNLQQNARLTEALGKATAAIESLSARVVKLESALHVPPCRKLEAVAAQVDVMTQKEKAIKARFSGIFWTLATNAVVGAAGVIGTMLVLGYKVWSEK